SYLPEKPAHFLDHGHLFERRLQTLGGRSHRIHYGVSGALRREPSLFAGGARGLSRFSELFSPVPQTFSRLAFLFAGFSCHFSHSPDLLRLASVGLRFRDGHVHFRLRAAARGIVAAGARLRWGGAQPRPPFRANVIVRH
ncbi:MAG TPA: hypothetical protein VL135_01910, partial [Terracidiphilus sp.]|nr:hypothetical protein [Terracidiphilus sp.]